MILGKTRRRQGGKVLIRISYEGGGRLWLLLLLLLLLQDRIKGGGERRWTRVFLRRRRRLFSQTTRSNVRSDDHSIRAYVTIILPAVAVVDIIINIIAIISHRLLDPGGSVGLLPADEALETSGPPGAENVFRRGNEEIREARVQVGRQHPQRRQRIRRQLRQQMTLGVLREAEKRETEEGIYCMDRNADDP